MAKKIKRVEGIAGMEGTDIAVQFYVETFNGDMSTGSKMLYDSREELNEKLALMNSGTRYRVSKITTIESKPKTMDK